MKQYALLIYGDETQWRTASEADTAAVYAEYEKFGKMLEERGAIRGGAELNNTSTATTVRTTGGETLVTDGPFAETTEQLGGFYLVQAADLDEAIEFAKALPAGTVEVRPLVTEEDRK